jgi:hypothetical protein
MTNLRSCQSHNSLSPPTNPFAFVVASSCTHLSLCVPLSSLLSHSVPLPPLQRQSFPVLIPSAHSTACQKLIFTVAALPTIPVFAQIISSSTRLLSASTTSVRTPQIWRKLFRRLPTHARPLVIQSLPHTLQLRVGQTQQALRALGHSMLPLLLVALPPLLPVLPPLRRLPIMLPLAPATLVLRPCSALLSLVPWRSEQIHLVFTTKFHIPRRK